MGSFPAERTKIGQNSSSENLRRTYSPLNFDQLMNAAIRSAKRNILYDNCAIKN